MIYPLYEDRSRPPPPPPAPPSSSRALAACLPVDRLLLLSGRGISKQGCCLQMGLSEMDGLVSDTRLHAHTHSEIHTRSHCAKVWQHGEGKQIFAHGQTHWKITLGKTCLLLLFFFFCFVFLWWARPQRRRWCSICKGDAGTKAGSKPAWLACCDWLSVCERGRKGTN